MNPKKYKISLDMLRMAARNAKGRDFNPCADEVSKVATALEAAKYNVRPLHKYVKAAEDCYREAAKQTRTGKASSLYYLSRYLDREKFKVK